MADQSTASSGKTAQELDLEMDDLRREFANLKAAIGQRADAIYEGAADKAARATQALKSQAQSVGEAVRDNPGTVSSAFVFGGLVGLLIGLAISEAETKRHWYDRYR